jgi:fibronectin-binding autotransporter adhesin
MKTLINTRGARLRQLDHFSRDLKRRLSTHQRLLAAMVVVLSACCAVPSYAAIVIRSGANDGFGASGFSSATGWFGGIAPDANDDFVAQNWDVRTANITGNETFAGNSLILTDGAALIYKGGDNHIVTINNFTIDAGVIRDTPNAGTGFTLAGNGVHLTSNGGIIWNGLGGGAGTTVSANIDGSGPLALGGGPVTTNTLSGTNTYTGSTLLLGGTITLSGPGALPLGNVLRFGSATPTAANGNATLNLNGGSYTIGGLSIASFNSVTANGTQLNPNTNSSAGKVMIHFATLPAGIQIGQLVSRTGVGNNYISGIDYSTNNVIFGDTGPVNSSGSFTFTSTSAGSGNQNQIITNTNTAAPSTLTFAGGATPSVFDGIITQAAGASTALTVSSGSLTLQRASGYTGNTTLTGGTLNLNFNSSGSPANNIVSATSVLNLAGGTLALNGTTSNTTTANAQTFASTNLTGSSAVQLTANFQGNNNANPRNTIALNLGAITRTTGTLDVTNPAGTLSATNGVLTTSGTASQVLTDASGAAYVTVGGVDWGATDASNAVIVALPSGSYTSSTATSLSGNADVVGNVALSGSTTVSTLRFNSGSRTVSGGTLATGGILMTTGSGASAINGGTLMGTSGGNLTIIQYNTGSNLSIGSVISDNGSATALNKSGAGAVVLSGANSYTGATNVLGGTLQFAKQVALYNNNNGSWTTPGNINVSNGATLALNVGGAGEFTPTDVGTLAGLSGFQSGSTLAIDTTNASGNVPISSPIANPNGGANVLGITKLGSGVLVLGAANTYTGPTTVSGGTLRLGASGSGSISSVTPVVLANVAGVTFDLNGNNTAIKSLSGGGSTGGTVALGAGNLTIGGGGNSTFAGTVTGTGGVTVLNGSSQSFTGAPGYSGGTTVNTGTLSLSPSGSSTVGSVTSNVTIAPNNLENGTLNVNAGVTLNANTILVGSVDTSATIGGFGTLTQTGGAINANTLFLGGAGPYTVVAGTTPTGVTSPSRGVLNLSGGTLTVPAVTTGNAAGNSAGGNRATINFNGGTLRAATGSNPSTFIDPNIGVTVQAGGAIVDTNGNTFSMTNNLVHDSSGAALDGGFTKLGSGTLTLGGTNTYTGVTAVSGGTLAIQLNNAASSGYAVNAAGANLDLTALGTFSLATGKTLQGIGTVITTGISHTAGTITGGVSSTPNSMGTLTFSNAAGGNLDLAGGTVRFDLSNSAAGTNDKIEANGGLTASAASIIDLEFAAFPSTSQIYRLFDYTGGSVSGSAANFVLAGNGGRGVTLNFSTPGQVNLNFVPGNPSANLIWNKTGAAPQNWDIQTTQSWNNTTQSILHDVFFNGDNVSFDNTAGVQTSVAIPNGVAVAPGSITVNSSTNNFSISSPGTGKISGTTSLVKSGSSTLTLSTSNDYQGGTTINDNGKIIALDVGSTGVASATGSGAVTVTANATLQIGDGATSGAGTVTGPVHNSGSVIVNRPDLFALNTPIDGTGTVTIQGGSTVQVNGTLTQTGNTVISNGTLQANGINTLPSSSTIVLANSASAILDFNGQAQAVGALEGGGATGGTVNASGNVTIAGGPGTHNFQGTFNGPTASITVDGPGGGPTQILSGSIAYSGNTTVNNGALTLSPSADTSIGTAGTTANIGINPSSAGTLTIGPHMTFTSGTIYVGSRADGTATNGQGTLIQTGGDIETNSLLLVGTNQAAGTANVMLNGGIMNVYTSGITMSINPNANNSASSASVTVNSGATLNVVNSNIVIGQFFNAPGTITVNGGNLTMASDNTGTPNPSGQIQFRNNNATNLGTYTVNLNGGVLTAGAIGINITADGAGGNFNVNEARRPTINFNGGTLRTATSAPDFFSPSLGTFAATRAAGGNPIAVNVMDNGGTIDTFGQTVGFSTVFAHAGTAAVDGGITLKDSSLTPGMLTLNAVSTYNGPTKIVSGTLQLGIANAINSASTIRMAGGVLSMNNFGQQAGGLKTTAASTIDMTTGNTGEVLQFADSTALHWVNGTTTSGATLHIANWTGNAGAGGGLDQILFPSTTALTGNQLNQIVFDGSGLTHAKLISVGGGAELVPTNTAPTGILKFGDINQDGVVNAADIPAFLTALTDLNHYKTLHSFNDVQMVTVADTNYDDVVTNADIQSLLDLVAGGGGAAAAVPEPSSCLLLGLGGFVVILRRRKKKSSTLRG